MKKFILPFFLFANLQIFAQQIPTYIPVDGLVGWWPFTGNANDGSGNNNHGTTSNATLAKDRFGNTSAAYLFNGLNSKIDVIDAASLRCRRITLSAWIKCSNTGVINQIIYKGSNVAEGEAYSLSLDAAGKAGTAYKINSGCQAGIGWNAGSLMPQSVDTNQWIHLVATYDGAIAKLYKNGVLEDSSAGPGLMDSCLGGGLRFGYDHRRYAASTGDPFNGFIDDIGIWNRALSPEEITGLYTATYADCGYGNMGVNICNPQRNLHIKDVMRLEPRSTPPDNPGEGDIYYDGTLHKLRVYDGTAWQNCF